MGRFEDLPPDQRATLQLLLTQGKSYAELAGLLRLAPDAVRDRAFDALDALGPDTPAGLTAERQDEISDYLLGQQSLSQRSETRAYLESSAPGRAWARPVASELRNAGAGVDVPDVPSEPAEVDEAFGALRQRDEADAAGERSSRLGGILLLAAIVIAVAALLVILLKPGGGDDDSSSSDQAAASTPADTTAGADTSGPSGASGQQAQIEQRVLMRPKDGSKALAIAYIFRNSQNHRVLGVTGANFAPFKDQNFAYAVWLTGGPDGPLRLGYVFTDVPASGKNKGQLVTGADPASIKAGNGLSATQASQQRTALTKALDGIYDDKQILITREAASGAPPTSPGKTVVSGDISRPTGAAGP